MKLKPSLAVLAVALAALAQPALAGFQFTQNEKGEVTHYNGIPLPPIPTVEEAKAQAQKEIAAAKKAQEAEQAAAASASNLQSEIGNQQLFFTGKPYLEETGQYLFLFRRYDPELARWTSADPSGFPDGANNIAYMPVPTSEFDWQGLATVNFNLSYGVGGFEGTYNYELARGIESASIGHYPGWWGLQTIGGTISIGGVEMGFVTDYYYVENNNSRYEYRTDDEGNRWKRYVVELNTAVKAKQVYGIVTVHWTAVDYTFRREGSWYE